MEVKGKIFKIGKTLELGSKGFRKREMVVETDERYPQKIMIEFIQDNCALLDSFNIGDHVDVTIELRGREWVNPQGIAKYFNSFIGLKIIKNSADEKVDNLVSNEIEDDVPPF